MYQLQPNETSGAGIRRIIQAQLEQCITLLTDPDGDRDVAVHETRKSMKRVRAALRLVRDELGESRFQQENGRFRDISRQLAPLRDSFVLIETLDALVGPALTAAAVAPLRQPLQERYHAVQEQFLATEGIVETAVFTLQTAHTASDTLPIHQTSFAPFANGLRRVYRRGRRRMAHAYATQPHDPETFHDWRKRVKYLWHQTELLHLIWPNMMKVLADELHTLSSLLGDAHDLAELSHTLQADPATFPPSPIRTALLQAAAEREQALEKAAWSLGQRLYAERPLTFTNRLASYYHCCFGE